MNKQVKRPIKVKEGDIFLVSFPKSGNTWLRFLIGTLYFNKKVDWLNIESLIPDVYVNSEKDLLSIPSPRIIKSHELYDPRYQKVIYIVRDVRDVVISYYYFQLKHVKGFNLSFDNFFNDFLKYSPWWENHVLGWINNQDKIRKGFLLLKYEDLINDINSEVLKIIRFLNISRTKEEINQAIKWTSFSNMKSLEKQQQYMNNQLKNTNHNIPFVRQGKINIWKTFLNEEQKENILFCYGKTLSKLGY
ncbi:sulfotransferase domain-containing protein [Alkalihalobacillus sp. BA299]|uniref:sulfotransferase domain-containing protein n=1 Tax=Alkalihalobacillus sp. BA299 TaxID=2815938 RepID=UPI001ADA5AE4|nr:sulfotransferase domain-containing protein [Alkalihalobacillus sp. BA299]